ncbi:MAG: hypothetical protein MJA30_28795 [Cytophagales bacterium]|nr:hypothetical protein [Cytophagales bacterium]
MELNEAKKIADAFNNKYEKLWNENKIQELSELYTNKSILVGYETVEGRMKISQLLQTIIDQGWTKIEIQTVKVELLDDVILIANEYQAIGSGENKGEIMKAKSSQVLTKLNNSWLTAMHTTT